MNFNSSFVETINDDNSAGVEEKAQEGAIPFVDLTSYEKIEDNKNSNSSSSNVTCVETSYDDISAGVEGKTQEGAIPFVDLTSYDKIGDDENQNDCSCSHPSDQAIQEAILYSSSRYHFSEESDVLVKVMPENFSNGFSVIQDKINNRTWIAGQAYKKKTGATHWIFVQGLQILGEALVENKSADEINFVLASYECIMDYLTLKSTPGHLLCYTFKIFIKYSTHEMFYFI